MTLAFALPHVDHWQIVSLMVGSGIAAIACPKSHPNWKRFLMVMFFAFVVTLAHYRDRHFIIGWGACGALHNFNKIGEKPEKRP